MISWQIILLRIALAAALGAVIGVERERKDWSAGMRTHMMVCVGSALVIIVSTFGFYDILGTKNVVLDPSRIAAQVISGIGFLGAGTIIFLRPGFIRGLTTASGLWTVAAIGLAVGSGMYIAAVITTVIAFMILLLLKPVEKRFSRYFKQKFVKITTELSADTSSLVKELISHEKLQVASFTLNKSDEEYIIEIKFDEFDLKTIMPTLLTLQKEVGVKNIFWSK